MSFYKKNSILEIIETPAAPLVGTKSQLLPKICFEGSPYKKRFFLYSSAVGKEKADVDQLEVVGPLDKTSPPPNQDDGNWNWVINL